MMANGCPKIGHGAFAGCSSLQSVYIRDSVEAIRKWAFKDCESLLSIVIPDSVWVIEEGAFKGCQSLKEIHCRIKSPKDVRIEYIIFDNSTFEECTLFVPPGTRWAYRHHYKSGKFKKIEIEPV